MDEWQSSSSSRSRRDTFKPEGTSLFSNRQPTTESKPKRMQWNWEGLENNDNSVEEGFSAQSKSRGVSGRSGDLSSSRNTPGLKRPVQAATPTPDPASKRTKTSPSSSFQKAQRRQERQRSQGSMGRPETDGIADGFSPPPQHRLSFFSKRSRTVSEATSPPQPQTQTSFFSKRAKPALGEISRQNKAPAPSTARKSTSGLFMDDDSDDTSDGSPPAPLLQDALPKPPADTISSETRKENDLLQIREKILKESARRRAEALAQRRQAPESNGLPQNKQEIQRESERRRAENVAKRRDASKSKANPPSPLQAIPAEAAQRQKRPVPLPPLSRPLSSSSKGNNQTLSATSGQDEITILGSKTASRAPEILAETQPVPFDNAAQKAKLDALFVESDQAAKQAETDRRRELDRQDQAHLKRERQLEQERIKKAAETKRRADDSRQKQAQVEAEEAARRAHEKQLQDALRRKHEAEAKVVAQKKAAAEKREAERRAEEQKRAKEQPPQHSVFSDEQQRARDERIRKQQERNRKMCTHADDSPIVVEDDEPHTTQLQPGSLAQQAREARQMAALDTTHADVVDLVQLRSQSSLAQSSFGDVNGSKAATSFDRPMRQIPGTKQSPPSGSTDFRRSLGEISFDDGKLLHWRDTDGKTFEDIARLYQTLTGKAQDEEFLKRRIILVKKALKLANVSWNLTNELAKGNEDAKAQINSLVHGDSEFRQPEPRPTPLAQPQPRGRDTSHRRALADILPEDAKLVAWKAAGDDWTQIISKFEQFTGKLRSQDTLRKRCRQIEKAIESARIRGDLMERLANGDKAAQTEINTLCAEKTGTSSKVGLAPGWKANTSRLPPEIAPLDAQLVRWRDSGSEWPSIRESWNDATGLRVAVDTLKGRYEALKEVFQNTLIDDELLNDMVRGVPGAKEDVNKRIFRATNPSLPRSPVRNDSAIEQRPLSRTNRMARSDSHGAETRPSNMAAEQFRSITSILDAYAGHEEIERPTTGGKTIDANFLWHAAQNMALSYEEALEEANESETESEVDPDDPEDYVYYTYTLYRKDKYYTGESDEDEVEDDEDSDSQWIPVSAPFESLKKANAAVQAELLKVNPKRRPIVSLDNMNLTSGTDERGLKWAKFINDQVGEVEVAVHRTLLNYTDGKLPQSKVDWIPKHFYKVMERQTITEKSTSSVQRDPGDELFEEECVVHHEKVYKTERQRPDMTTSLEQANNWAADYFAKTTISQKANLNETDKLRKAKTEGLLSVLDENELFRAEERDIDGNKFEVWVEKATMSGPRNI